MERYEQFKRHLLEDERPSEYFNKLADEGLFPKEYPYDILIKLKNIEQNPKYHPEGNVWNHTMNVIDEAAKRKDRSSCPEGFMVAALLHDIGKLTTTKLRKGRITSYDHESVGAEESKKVLKCLGYDENSAIFKYIVNLIRLHMQVLFVITQNGFENYKEIARCTQIEDLGLIGICDRLGRGAYTDEDVKREEENRRLFIERCRENIK